MTHSPSTANATGSRAAIGGAAAGSRAGSPSKATARLATLALLLALALAALLAASAPPAHAVKLKTLVAPVESCPKQNSTDSRPFLQERAMRCLINQARERIGMRRLDQSLKLRRSSDRKTRDMQVCGSFDHYACGRDFTYWMDRMGFTKGCWKAAENIAWGENQLGSPRQIFTAWLRSEPHRENIFADGYSKLGVGVRSGPFEGRKSTQVWTMHMGDRC